MYALRLSAVQKPACAGEDVMLRSFFRRRLRTLSSLDAYALWADTYPAQAHNTLMQLEQQAVASLLPPMRHKRVLDVACGSGRYMEIAQASQARVMGCDNSLAMLQHATLPVAAADCAALPFPTGWFDIVICGLAIGHLTRIDTAIHEMARVLASDGVLVVSDLHPYQTLNGAKRTFQGSDGRTYAVEHHLHGLETVVTALMQAGMIMNAVREPVYNGQPVVLVWRAVKR